MTAEEFLAALDAAGIPREGMLGQEFDRAVAELLDINERTARRYRLGETAIPGPVVVALKALAAQRRRPR